MSKELEKRLDYYMDYEFQAKMMSNSIATKGQEEPEEVLNNPKELKEIIEQKNLRKIWSEHLKNLPQIMQSSKAAVMEIKDTLKRVLSGEGSVESFVEQLEFPYEKQQKPKLLEAMGKLRDCNNMTLCYPLYQKKNDRTMVTKPFLTFQCRVEDGEIIVDSYFVNRDILTMLVAYIENCTMKEIQISARERFDGLYKKLNTIGGQGKIEKILTIIADEVKAEYAEENPQNIWDIKDKEGWSKLNRVFVTTEELQEMIVPIFSEELRTCKEVQGTKETAYPRLMTKYLLGSEDAQDFESINGEVRFHYGSYTGEFPINEKQWQIVTLCEDKALMAVDGPPGTGKTTLLKEVIADNITRKAKLLLDIWDEDWTDIRKRGGGSYDPKGAKQSPLKGKNPYSVILTSTNNTAVDNIGMELLAEIPYFSGCHQDATGGLLCAKLGNGENITNFYEEAFKKLLLHLNAEEDSILEDEAEEVRKQEFAELWEELTAIHEEIENFFMGAAELEEAYGVGMDTEEIEGVMIDSSDQLAALRAENCHKEEKLRDIQEVAADLLKRLKTGEEKCHLLDEALSGEESRLKELYGALERFEDESQRKRLKGFLGFVSKECKAFISAYPTKTYVEDEISQCRNRINKMREEQEEATAGLKELEAAQGGCLAEKQELLELCKQIQMNIENLTDKREMAEEVKLSKAQLKAKLGITEEECRSLYGVANCEKVYKLRNRLFEKSLRLTEAYIVKHSADIRSNLVILLSESANGKLQWCGRFYSPTQQYSEIWETAIRAVWETFFLCFPVVTTTLHSFRKEVFPMITELVDVLLTDEAGQILPHYLAAPLYRATRAIIVGDVYQLEPIRNSGDESLSHCQIEESEWKGVSILENSVQSYADRHSDVFETMNNVRCGLVLNEHRRCERSIMEFSNRYIYEGKIKVVTPDNHDKLFGSNLVTLDIRGSKGKGHYNDLEVQACRKIVDRYISQYGQGIVNEIGIISPFRKQINVLKKSIPHIECGTIHSFQGRAKKIIIFTTVIDSAEGEGQGLGSFVGGAGNLLNVAFSRAKEQFILVGNLSVIEESSKFLRLALSTIEECGKVYSFFKENPPEEDLEETEIHHWEDAARIIAGDDSCVEEQNSELGLYLMTTCPRKILIDPTAHYELLKTALARAEKSICIASPWISGYVVDEDFLELVRAASQRQVTIQIMFGYQGEPTELTSKESIAAVLEQNNGFDDQIAQTAEHLFIMKETCGVSIIYSPPLHTKLLLLDDTYMLIGSHNWLQNSGKSKNVRREMSCLITNKESIDYVKKAFLEDFS